LHLNSGIQYYVGGTAGGEGGCIISLLLQNWAEIVIKQFPDAGALIPEVALGRLVEGQFAC